MGRSMFPWTTIDRMMSAARREERENNRAMLIAAQESDIKELPLRYTLQNVDFNRETRQTKIEICEEKKYRTIERYVTQNYVRYPIYSDWKTKTKIIKKNIKLTNSELESLKKHTDELIRKFASDIIIELYDTSLIPSWFYKDIYRNEYEESLTVIDNKLQKTISFIQSKISFLIDKNNSLLKRINEYELIQASYYKKLNKLKNKLSKLESSNPKKLFSFLREKKLGKYKNKKSRAFLMVNLFQKNIDIKKKEINYNNSCISLYTNQQSDIYTYATLLRRLEKVIYRTKISATIPLPTIINTDNDFLPLKTIIGMEYTKIIGCYIIRNTKNNKFYVGQSKDVYRRLKQHFNGTVPKNIIFAEDYYATNIIKRDTLFEVKILPCATKDELDKTEKELIELYDAKNNGYNGTSGNT